MFGSLGLPELVLLVILCIPCVVGAVIAAHKGRSAILWFILSGSWVGVLVILFLPPVKEVPGRFRQCPACKEFVRWGATICKHCHTEIAAR